ncbi:hypothetical protein D910_09391 [Dendroctonus ponderosae]|uniref:Rab-GAP TBC domain-containing protein n=1 Tax=Dendroctonus ponderosae TaxID=77166 RepID=U4UDL9_DENPD|nr:hypothetical protein D910_09391 [Dendroctonus ponderosae]
MSDKFHEQTCDFKVGQSTFYGTPVNLGDEPLTQDLSPAEKQDSMKLDHNVDQDCTIFSGITYLGAAQINAPKSEVEIHRNMAILNEQSVEQGIKVAVSVPLSSQGLVVLYDGQTNSVISRYEVHRILFYARGSVDSNEAGCFSFTWSHGDSQESAIFLCHVFRCDIVEAVSRVSACFAKAFQRAPKSMSSSVTSASDMMCGSITALPEPRTLMYVFEVNLEIKEEDGKGSYSTVGKDRNGFRLKTNILKQLLISIKQVSDNGPHLVIERCFGVLIASGRHVRHSDMRLLERNEQKNHSTENNCTSIIAMWDPTEQNFEPLNAETQKDTKQYMTVGIDLVIRGIQEPVRFVIETPVRIFGQSERNFWYFQKKTLIQQFYLNLRETISSDLSEVKYEVLNMETSGELDRNLLNLNLNLSSLIQSPSITSIDTLTPKEEYHSDGDEPLLSGTGLVSKDCSEVVLESWADLLTKWKQTDQRPKQLASLVKLGIPEALRGEVWQRLAGVQENSEMMNMYRVLITKMPEEQAFCVLVNLMYDYKLRDFYKQGFENLYLRLYQLNRLMEEQLNPLWNHFTEHRIETHMFASQWFLTLFTARFPLYFVFHIIDVFLLQDDWEIISSDSEAQDRRDSEASEVEKLRMTVQRLEEEKLLMLDEISQLKEMLKREVDVADTEKRTNSQVIHDYKMVRQRLDVQLNVARQALDSLKDAISNCPDCVKFCGYDGDYKRPRGGAELTGDARIRELELELAQTKLAHVEAECRNQLRYTEQELTAARSSWAPWMSKAITSIKEVAKPNAPTNSSNTSTFISHINNAYRRDSVPLKEPGKMKVLTDDIRRESAPVIKDSQSCNSLKTHHHHSS